MCTRFEWRIDDTFSFYGNWHAVLYPMQYDVDNSVSQGLEVEPPSTGSFSIECTSDQDGFYSTTANLTLNVTGGGNGNGTAVIRPFHRKKNIDKNHAKKQFNKNDILMR